MSIHVDQYKDLQKLEDKLNELDKNHLGDSGEINNKLIDLSFDSDNTGWVIVLTWRD